MPKFCDRLKELRLKSGLTQGELGERLGVKLRAYQLYESGNGYPTFQRLLLMADFFDVALDYLVGRSDISERR